MTRYGSLTGDGMSYLTVTNGDDKYRPVGVFYPSPDGNRLLEKIVSLLNTSLEEEAVAELRTQLEQGGEPA